MSDLTRDRQVLQNAMRAVLASWDNYAFLQQEYWQRIKLMFEAQPSFAKVEKALQELVADLEAFGIEAK